MTEFEDFIKKNNLKKKDIAIYLGVSNAFITQIVKRIRKLPEDKLALIKAKSDWDVSMFSPDYEFLEISPINTVCVQIPKNKVVPLYDYTGIGEIIKGRDHTPNDYIYVPNLTSCDGAVYMRGDSMAPFINPGDVVLYKKVKNIVNFGEIYLILTYQEGENYVLIKYVRQSDKEGYVKLANYSSESRPYDFPINDIHGLALVKASIKYISML